MELPLLNRPSQALTPPPYPAARQHNIENFSPQEKRILSIFFQNHDMTFSYIDIAKVLGKSANTVKNQMHQLSMKADLFERSIDQQNRNRFKLKDGLKVEQYLNVN
jgi:DNA-binding CsgD family transcriptional regulator